MLLARFPNPPTTAAALRLITCAGTFDHRRRGHRGDLLVSAATAAGPQAQAGR